MTVNYRIRCEQDNMIHGLTCRVIRYGMTKDECNAGLYSPSWYDVRTKFASEGGRRTPRENETTKHFFNKRIMTDEEKNRDLAIQSVHGGGDPSGVGTCDGEGSPSGVEETEARAEGVGCGDQQPYFNWETDVTS